MITLKEGDVVTLWSYFTTGPREYFTTKIQAERACRLVFPNEDQGQRDIRIFYIQSDPHQENI